MTDLPPDPTPVPPASPTPPESPAGPDASPTPISRRGLTVAIVFVLAIFLAGVWLVITELPRLLTGARDTPTEETSAPPPVDTRKLHVSLFYVSESGLELVATPRDVPYGASPSEQARRIVEAQIQAPPDGLVSAIPPETTVHAVYLSANGEAYVDLGPEIVAHHTGGALDEALAVYAIVNALTTNLNGVTAVQILIDGKEVDTLAGHVDLRRPLTKTLDWIRKGK